MNTLAVIGNVPRGHVCTPACDPQRYSDGACPQEENEIAARVAEKMVRCARCNRFSSDTYEAFVKHLHYGECDRMVEACRALRPESGA